MHVHVHDTDELPLYIANGVTGIRIMSGERDTAARRAELARESKCKAQISWIAGYVFGGISATPSQEHTHQSRNTRAGSVRMARQAGKRQAATEAIVITANADPNASGSLGLTS